MTVQIQSSEQVQEAAHAIEEKAEHISHVTYSAPDETGEQHVTTADGFDLNQFAGVGRNDPCPCGSGKKFKQCHGKLS